MRHLPLIWKGIWRNTTRTIFTFLSIFAAFLLFGLLQGVSTAFDSASTGADLARLYVDSRFGSGIGLPMSHLAKIEAVPGVKKVAYATWFGGYYRDPHQPVFSLAVDVARYFSVYPEIQLPPAQLKALQETRGGAVVSEQIAQKYGWSIGDRVPLHSSLWRNRSDGGSTWAFDIVGIFHTERRAHSDFLFNAAYFDESRVSGKGKVAWYVAELDDPGHSAQVAAAIDKLFENSFDETRTQNEQETAQAFLKQLGDINFIVDLIIGAVFFTLLFLTGNAMMQSVNERIPEFAILEAVGYSSGLITAIIFSEALLLCLVAALLGLVTAWAVFPLLQGFTFSNSLSAAVFILGLGFVLLLVVAAGAPAALRISRLNVIDALAGR